MEVQKNVSEKYKSPFRFRFLALAHTLPIHYPNP